MGQWLNQAEDSSISVVMHSQGRIVVLATVRAVRDIGLVGNLNTISSRLLAELEALTECSLKTGEFQ